MRYATDNHRVPGPALPRLCALLLLAALAAWSLGPAAQAARAGDLDDIRASGELRHLGIPYAGFITGSGDGLDVELMRRFAEHLGVRYRFVDTDWAHIFSDLTGETYDLSGERPRATGAAEIKGDVIANGLTILDWRQEIIAYSAPTFPTQVWCVTRHDSPVEPITSSGDLDSDIEAVKKLLQGRRVLGKEGTCLTPGLYGIDHRVAEVLSFPGSLNDIAPAVLKGEADIALLDVPDSLVALDKWSGQIKVLGPLSEHQFMAPGFRKQSPELLAEFNRFYAGLRSSGEYRKLVEKYYPAVFWYFPNFFND